MLSAQIEQNTSVGRKMDCRVLDVRDVDVSSAVYVCFFVCVYVFVYKYLSVCAVLEIAVGHRTFSDHYMTDHMFEYPDKMSGQKRPSAVHSKSASKDVTPSKRALLRTTVDKWITQSDKELNTVMWLKYNLIDRIYVKKLRCAVCTQFKSKLEGMRNYSANFIEASDNL